MVCRAVPGTGRGAGVAERGGERFSWRHHEGRESGAGAGVWVPEQWEVSVGLDSLWVEVTHLNR